MMDLLEMIGDTARRGYAENSPCVLRLGVGLHQDVGSAAHSEHECQPCFSWLKAVRGGRLLAQAKQAKQKVHLDPAHGGYAFGILG
jgi:hypothetical protein